MKKHKKIMSYALACALAAGNLSGVVAAPLTTIVAQAQEVLEEGDWYINEEDGTRVTTKEYTLNLGTKLLVKGAVPEADEPVEARYAVTFSENNKDAEEKALLLYNEGVISVNEQATLPATETTITVTVTETLDPESQETAHTATLNLTVVAPSISLTFDDETTVHNIPDYSADERSFIVGDGSGGLELTAIATIDEGIDISARPEAIAFAVFNGATKLDNTYFSINAEEAVGVESTLSQTFSVVSAAKATEGAYTAIAWIDADADGTVDEAEEDMSASYEFSVTKCATSLTVRDANGKDESDPLKEGETSPALTLYAGSAPIASGVKWSATKTGAAAVMSVNNSTGEARITKASDAEATSDTVNAVYKLNNDLSYELNNAYKVNIAKKKTVDYAVGFVDDKGKPITGEVALEGGETVTAQMLYDEDVVEGVEWSIPSTAAATINKSTGLFTAKDVAEDVVVEVTGKYFDGSKNITRSETVTVKALTYEYTIGDDAKDIDLEARTATLREGKSAEISISKSNGTDFDGTITWKSNNLNVASVTKDGIITIAEGAAEVVPAIATITPLLDGKPIEGTDGFTITATAYAKEIEVTADKEELFYGDTATFTASYEDEDGNDVEITDGTWKVITEEVDEFVKLKDNKLEVITTVDEDTDIRVGFWTKDNENDEPDASATVTVKAETFALTIDDRDPVEAQEGAVTDDITNMEIGETHTLVVTFGNNDITSKMKWTPSKGSEDYISIQNGTISALKEGVNVSVEGVYVVDGETLLTATVTVGQVFGKTDALAIATEAKEAADGATESAGDATLAANDAINAAEATIEDPTAANLEIANQYLTEANENLDDAKAALEIAKAKYADAVAAGAKSAEAKAAVEAAEDAVKEAEDEVKAAEAAIKEAKKAYEAADAAVKEQAKLDAIAAANEAADKAVLTPTADNIKTANEAVDAAKTAGASDEDLKTIKDKIATAEEAAAKGNADEEAAAAKQDAENAKKDAATAKQDAAAQKDAAAKAAASAAQATNDANAAKADAAANKAAADKATADAAAAQANADAANATLAAMPKKQKNVEATNGMIVNTYADGTAMLMKVPAKKIDKKGKFTAPKTVTVNGIKYTVTKLGRKLFYKNKKIKTFVAPDTVTEIGASCFEESTLKTATLNGKDVTIKDYVFKKTNKKINVKVKDEATKKNIKARGNLPKNGKVTIMKTKKSKK